MFLSPPAHLIGQKGSAYRYGPTVVGGTINMWGDGQTMYPLIPTQLFGGGSSINAISLLLGGTGGGSKDQMLAAAHAQVGPGTPGPPSIGPTFVLANGEAANRLTTTAQYGAQAIETFGTNGTVSVTAGGPSVVGAATTWTTDVLNTAYAYTPSENKLRIGDLIDIIQSGTHYFHRITAIGGATSMTIYPVWQGTTAAGLAYITYRSGYGSRSRIVTIFNTATGTAYAYYAGGFLGQGLVALGSPATVPAGTVQCVSSLAAHFMGPQTATGAVDVYANDVALYKSFLLYGAGNTIGWSVAGFPTSFTTGFGAGDFPAQNIAILDTDAEFVSFEFWGDQVVAICERGIYLVRPTGAVPEFDIQKLPETTGPDKYAKLDPGPGFFASARPTCTAKGQVYMATAEGLVRFDGIATSVYSPVGPWPWQQANGAYPCYGLVFDPALDLVAMWCPGTVAAHPVFLVYSPVLDQWWSIDPFDFSTQALSCLLSLTRKGDHVAPEIRQSTLAFYGPTGDRLYYFDRPPQSEAGAALAFTASGWLWAAPIQYQSDIYGDYAMGGFAVRGRSRIGDPGPINLNWTTYGGSSPYNMVVRDSGTFDYSAGGTPDSRHIIGKLIDDAYAGVVLSGLSWIELAGIDIYDAATESRR